MSLAALATVLVASLGWVQMQGLYVAPEQMGAMAGAPIPAVDAPLLAAGFWTGLFWTVALLTSLLAGGLQRALQQSREQAQELRELSNHLEARVAAQTAELAQRAAKAEALYEVSQALTSTLDLDQILDLITEQAARLLGFDSAHVMLQGADGRFTLLGAFPHAALNGDAAPGGDGAAALAPLVQEMAASRQPARDQPAPRCVVRRATRVRLAAGPRQRRLDAARCTTETAWQA